MRTRAFSVCSVLAASIFALPLMLAACGGDDGPPDDEAFATLQDCFDDHHSGTEGLSVTEAITVCCIDHPINGIAPSCGNTQTDCEDHVDAELDTASATADEISDACADYLIKK